jgi:hypothetical protein
VVVANAGFATAFDAVDNGTGTIYFTGIDANGSTVFTTTDDGTHLTATDLGVTGLTAGLGVSLSKDGKTLYVADPAAETDTFASGAITGTTLGQIVAVDTSSGGAATPVTGTQGYAPVGLATLSASGTDTLYFTGQDPANGKGGVFTIAAGGGAATALGEGSPFINPSGLLVAASGTAYVVDRGQVISVTAAGAATVLASGLNVGFPGGIGISEDASTLYVSAVDPAVGNDAVAEIKIASGAVTYALSGATASGGFGPSLVEPGGLQGGTISGALYVFVDGLAGGTGKVYTLPLH